MTAPPAVFFRVDEAWDFLFKSEDSFSTLEGMVFPGQVISLLEPARHLRFITSSRAIRSFREKYSADLRPFTLTGSGDFHHLTAVWLSQFKESLTVITFDNHPDWDRRPPHWACGAWVNRALENPLVSAVHVWGCDNFECRWPARLLANRRAARAGRLVVHPWQQEGIGYPKWLKPMTQDSWPDYFWEVAQSLAGTRVYVSIDLDSLRREEAWTNWEQGRFTLGQLSWALETLRKTCDVVGGDLCGAASEPRYANRFQKLAGFFDHPSLASLSFGSREEDQSRNYRAWSRLWPVLTGTSPEPNPANLAV